LTVDPAVIAASSSGGMQAAHGMDARPGAVARVFFVQLLLTRPFRLRADYHRY
jgi:hypothetical protein